MAIIGISCHGGLQIGILSVEPLGKVDMFGFAVLRVIRGPCYGHGEEQIIIMSHSVLNIWKIIGKGNNLAETSEVETRVLSPEKYFV